MLFPSIFDDMAFNEKDYQMMKCDVLKGADETKLIMDVPGFKKEDINIELRNGYLTVSASLNNEKKEEENDKYIYRERSTRSCSRSFEVGNRITYEDVSASLDNGVLTVCVKHNNHDPETKRIEIQ